MNWSQIVVFTMIILALSNYILNGFYLKFTRRNTDESATSESPYIVNGIFWSDLAESYVPKGLSFDECVKYTVHLQRQAVEISTKSTMGVCGRQLNALIKLKDGTSMCAKYRGKYKAYGEVLTFYLSRLLNMNNVPLVFLVKTNATSVFWKQVNISSLSWEEDQIVTLIEWISNT
ncbi:four-jointed box protein 1-like [Mercenaria mercenaria]|uniref:four-jointed box protein 1-like n=1 Tax=Mercenaria mercenaria TaxID=6596 RepID=UPI00234F8497|nr:four-jointed box protein 1-like [Mercenaria mercenaria]